MNKMRWGIVATIFLLFASQGFAWYNDAGNDSCLVAYSDKDFYGLSPGQTDFEVIYRIENNCGKELTADAGTYFDNEIMILVDVVETRIGTDLNDMRKKAIGDIGLTPSFKEDFTELGKTSGITLKDGNTYITMIYRVPKPDKKREFALTIRDQVDDKIKSILDPWWDEVGPPDFNYVFYDPFNTGEIDNNWDGNPTSWSITSGYADHDAGGPHQGIYRATPYTLTDFNFFAKVYFTSADTDLIRLFICSQTAAVDSPTGYYLELSANDFLTLQYEPTSADIIPTVGVGFGVGWYDINISRSPNGQFFAYVNGGFIAKSAAGGWQDYNTCQYTSIFSEDQGNRIDEIMIYNTGAQLPGDLNISAIDGYAVETPFPIFSYYGDGNLTIDFNVQHPSNTRGTIDLRYGSTLIVNDLNLTAAVCPDQNFETVSTCSWDWNIHRSLVPDGNYSINGTITFTDNATATDTISNSLRVGNDVNVLVKIPFDEVTSAVIDIVSKYTFDVSVLDDTNLTNFRGNTADIYLNLRKGTNDPIIITVDTNDDSAYLSREYSLTFTTETDYTLQPYLVPVASGISTKIITQDIVDYTPIGNVQIDVYRIVEGSGRTLIETVITDSKGEAFVSGIANENYEYVVTFEGEEVQIFNITVTSTLITILFKRKEFDPPIQSPLINVQFLPSESKLLYGLTNLQQVITTQRGSISAIQVYATEVNDANGTLDINRYSVTLAPDSNTSKTNTVSLAVDLAAWDLNRSLRVVVLVEAGGAWYKYQTTYRGYQSEQVASKILQILRADIATDLGCSDISDCGLLTAIAVILTLVACAGLVMLTPLQNLFGISVAGILILSFFTFLGWVPFYWFFIALLFVVIAGVVEWRR